MESKDLYSQAHLIVSAIRVLEHQTLAPPAIDEVCRMLGYTLEQGHLLCRKLKETGIINIVTVSFDTRLSVRDHLLIEDLPRGIQETHLDRELKAFQDREGTAKEKEVTAFKAKQDEKKRALFAEIEKKLKGSLDQK